MPPCRRVATTWWHQGSADHAHRRRHPLAQRGAAPAAGPLRVPAPGALVRRRAVPGAHPGEDRHGHLPREHRGHLRRHRVRGGQRDSVPRSSWSFCCRTTSPIASPRSASRDRGIGIKPVSGGHRAPRAGRHPVRDRQRPQERHVRPQGQHHEVHRGRLPQLGLRARRERVPGTDLHLGPVGAHGAGQRRKGRQRGAGRARSPTARSWSRTRSPTSRCSRCSRGRRNSTSSPR
jgi:hypothetical protein